MIYQEYLLKVPNKKNIVNDYQYAETLFNLRTAIKSRQPGMLNCGVILIGENATLYTAGRSFWMILNGLFLTIHLTCLTWRLLISSCSRK